MRLITGVVLAVVLAAAVAAQSPSSPDVWPVAKVQAILERTPRTRLAPDLSPTARSSCCARTYFTDA
jgi:hypothetical protein